MRYYRASINLKPEIAELYFEKARIQRIVGETKKSYVLYRKATILKPDYTNAYNNMGNTLTILDQKEQAIEIL